MEAILVLFCLFLTIFSIWNFQCWNKNNKKLPPGPINLPILGFLPFIDAKAPHITFHRLIQRYGKTVFLKFGQVPCVIMADPEIIKRCFTKCEFLAFKTFFFFLLVFCPKKVFGDRFFN